MPRDRVPPDPFDPKAELAFVEAVLARREEAIEEFANRVRCVPRILAAQNARLGRPLDDHELADLAQDTVLVILRKLDRFAGRAPLEGWMYRVCCLELMNYLRGRRRQPTSTAVELTDEAVMTVDAAGSGTVSLGDQESVNRALERVGGAEAETIRLKHFEGLTFEEIGMRLDLSPNTAKTRYYRGLTRLERYLRDQHRGEEEA